MSTYSNIHLLIGNTDGTGEYNEFTPNLTNPVLEHSPFGNDGVQRCLGRPSDTASASLVLKARESADTNRPAQKHVQDLLSNGSKVPFIAAIGSNPATIGDICYFAESAGISSVETPVRGGDLARMNFSIGGDGPFIFGKVAQVGTIDDTSGTNTGITMPAVTFANGKKLFALLLGYRAASGSGPVTFVVESAAASDFTGATTRFTFTALSTATHQLMTLKPTQASEDVDDTHWRVKYTGTGSPDLDAAIALGVF